MSNENDKRPRHPSTIAGTQERRDSRGRNAEQRKADIGIVRIRTAGTLNSGKKRSGTSVSGMPVLDRELRELRNKRAEEAYARTEAILQEIRDRDSQVILVSHVQIERVTSDPEPVADSDVAKLHRPTPAPTPQTNLRAAELRRITNAEIEGSAEAVLATPASPATQNDSIIALASEVRQVAGIPTNAPASSPVSPEENDALRQAMVVEGIIQPDAFHEAATERPGPASSVIASVPSAVSTPLLASASPAVVADSGSSIIPVAELASDLPHPVEAEEAEGMSIPSLVPHTVLPTRIETRQSDVAASAASVAPAEPAAPDLEAEYLILKARCLNAHVPLDQFTLAEFNLLHDRLVAVGQRLTQPEFDPPLTEKMPTEAGMKAVNRDLVRIAMEAGRQVTAGNTTGLSEGLMAKLLYSESKVERGEGVEAVAVDQFTIAEYRTMARFLEGLNLEIPLPTVANVNSVTEAMTFFFSEVRRKLGRQGTTRPLQ